MKDIRLSTQTHLQFLKLSSLRTIETLPIVSFLETLLLLFSCLWFYVVRKNKSETYFICKKKWQKTFGLRKVANMFQSFFQIFPSGTFFITLTPCCLSISSCSSPPQIVLFFILLYFLNLNYQPMLIAHLLNLEYLPQLQIVSKQLAMFKLNQVPKYHNKGAHVQHFLPFSPDFQIIMLMLRLEVGEGER